MNPHLNARLKVLQLVNPLVELPKTKAQCLNWFVSLMNETKPENLAEGFFPYDQAQMLAKLETLKNCWQELESLMGRPVPESEVLDFTMIKHLAHRKSSSVDTLPPAA